MFTVETRGCSRHVMRLPDMRFNIPIILARRLQLFRKRHLKSGKDSVSHMALPIRRFAVAVRMMSTEQQMILLTVILLTRWDEPRARIPRICHGARYTVRRVQNMRTAEMLQTRSRNHPISVERRPIYY